MSNFLSKLKRGQKYDLAFILESANPNTNFDEKVLWLERLFDWIRGSGNGLQEQTLNVRLKFWLQLFERNPTWKEPAARSIVSVLAESSALRLFTETGIPSWTSFPQEFMSRLIRVFISPEPEHSRSLKHALEEIFYDERDAELLAKIPEPLRAELFNWLKPTLLAHPKVMNHLLEEMISAALLISIKAAAITVRQDFASRSKQPVKVLDYALLKLENDIRYLMTSPPEKTLIQNIETNIKIDLAKGREILAEVKAHLEKHGVSVDLVYQRERLKAYLDRIELLVTTYLSVRLGRDDQELLCAKLMVTLVQGNNYDRDFFHLLRTNFDLLSKKIVDFTGNTGKHFIAQNSADYNKMFRYAAGGGFLTAFTIMIKYASKQEGWPLFIQLCYNFLNYSTSFLVMHFLHFKLATKQPSMTAAALASKLQLREDAQDDDIFVQEIAKISRSQFASVLGNLVAVIPTALLLDYIWSLSSGHSYLDATHAQHILESISPWKTATVLYAAMTGVLLWLSGLTSGWIENANAFYHIPDRIRNHKILKNALGEKRTKSLASAFDRNISGIASSISLGFYLALWPTLGAFFGLPLDIRHITLTTGAVSMAIHSLGIQAISGIQWFELTLGIVFIGTMNFAVSFSLATLVAVRAKELSGRRTLSIFKKAALYWRQSPRPFFIPPK